MTKKSVKELLASAKLVLLILLFCGLLSIPYLDFERYYFTWFAFVPLLFAIEKASLKKTYILATLAGTLAFASGMYWIVDFIDIAKGSSENVNIWLALLNWVYCSQLIALVLVLFNWARRNTSIHEFLLFPVLLASITSIYPMLFAMRLADSQISFHMALQATEFLGPYALDAIIALANIMIFRVMFKFSSTVDGDKKASRSSVRHYHDSKWAWGIGGSLIVVWLGYGVGEIQWWDVEISNWQTMKVGIIQPNEQPKLTAKKSIAGYSKSYPPELDMSERLANLNPDLIIWPEAHPKQYLNDSAIKSAYLETVEKMSVSLMFQDIRQVKDVQSGKTLTHFNSAILIDEKGEQIGLYNKIKRIPFGEYVPLLDENSWLHGRIESFLGKFLTKYSKGQNHQLFENDKLTIVPLICYETTFPSFVANAVSTALEQRQQNTELVNRGTMLVALSNDGWFGSTKQPYQHVMGSILRAVENRVPLVHVSNNGPSIVVTPQGKVTFASPLGQRGGYLAEVPVKVDSKRSFYGRYPNLFTNALYIFLFLVISMSVLGQFKVKRSSHK